MFWTILKKDLKRKKTMNVILLIFITVASMFAASGLNNLMVVIQGVDSFIEKAEMGNFYVLTMGENAVGAIDDLINNEGSINSYTKERVIYGSKKNIKHDGEELQANNSTLFQGIKGTKIKLFDEENQLLTEVPKGKAVVSGDFLEKNNLKVGDIITIEMEDVKLELELAGRVKDALLGTPLISNTRIVINDEDFKKLTDNEKLSRYYSGEVYYIDTEDATAMEEALSDANNIAFYMSKAKFKVVFMMDMIVAAIVILVSLALMIVSFLVLRFTINNTIMEEYREIGVMKAIGLKNLRIRGIYIVKYLMMAIVGSLIGFGLSFPFAKLLLKNALESMVIENDGALIANVAGSLLVIIITVLFAFLCTKKVKKVTPVDAIRTGQTGERFRKKTVYRLGKSHSSSPLYLALNDFISAPRKFLSMIITFCICCSMVLVVVNTSETMCSDNLMDLFLTKSDVYMENVDKVMSFMKEDGEADLEKYFEEVKKKLADNGMPAELGMDFQYKYKVKHGEKEYKITCQQGYNFDASEYKYYEGTAPAKANEVAITPKVAEMLDAKIGDEISIYFGDSATKCIVTAYQDTMNNMGEIVRLHQDAPTSLKYSSSGLAVQINFTDNPGKAEIAERIEKMKTILNNDRIRDAADYCKECVGVVDTMKAVELMLLVITAFVIILVTLLMESSFVSQEKTDIALLKSLGFKDGVILRWHMYRFGIVALVSVLLAVIISMPMTKLCITPIFTIMGARSVDFYFNIPKIFLYYPGIIFLITIIVAALAAQLTRKIKSNDIRSIE